MLKQYILFLGLILGIGCQQKSNFPSPPGYDFNNPEKMVLEESLLEISGITFSESRPGEILAINDEEGLVFSFQFNGNEVEAGRFTAGGGDFEDIAVYNNNIFVLRSNGTILTFSEDLNSSESRKLEKIFPSGEYESLYIDKDQKLLYVLCKKCDREPGEDLIQGYTLDLEDDSWENINSLTINISSANLKSKKGFMASALTKNPITKEWFILSSVNKALLVTDEAFKVSAVYTLSPTQFNQPEGVAFDSEGNLYISNEGDKIRNGNILKFSYDEGFNKSGEISRF